MDIPPEEEELPAAVVPAVVGRQHIVVLPHVGGIAEIGGIQVGAVLQAGSLDERGIGIHVHRVVEDEEIGLGVVGTVIALDDLAVLVAHGTAVLEHGHGVLGIVVQVAGAQGVVVLVFQLHQGAPELGQVFIYHILKRFALETGAVLDNLHMPHGVDDVGGHVPEGGVAEQVGVVVEELRGPSHLAEILPALLQELGRPGADERYLGGGVLAGRGLVFSGQTGGHRRQEQQGREGLSERRKTHYSNWFFQLARSKSQALYIGSMTM